ncbi:aromatic-L-amino-acid decarboxylase [Fusarium austroafricanum]|uniref:Aromatic-L-amino-acid decarboxylase n=1 Tax=Fusarium austroafricanum TaxID=2364996 RepID=A0A8H4P4Z1_9HYPO|nr:aromatic-L-amino-acid decarboxylase [Fusarium austroafricanum]
MDSNEFREAAKVAIDNITNYYDNVESQRVVSDVKPGYLRPLLPSSAPLEGESWSDIDADIQSKILPGITHWASPRFMAFFPCSGSYPAALAEMYSNTFNGAHFNWICSPAVTELETIVMDWLAKALALPECYLSSGSTHGGGVIHGSASEAILTVMCAARDKYLAAITKDLPEDDVWHYRSKLVALGSAGSHSSTKKAAQILGVRFVSIPVSEENGFSMTGAAVAKTVADLRARGLEPFYLTATMGTTDVCAVDDFAGIVEALAPTAETDRDIWVHVDAAYAGSALLLEENQCLTTPMAYFHSFNFNPHKWMLTTFDCSAVWVRSRAWLIEALSIKPPYLRNQFSDNELVTDYRDWQIPLGRRFRSLKLWTVMRSFGIRGLQAHIRNGVELAETLQAKLTSRPDLFTIFTPARFGLVTFRVKGADEKDTCARTERLYECINGEGRFYLTSTVVNEKFAIRVCTGVERVKEEHVQELFKLVSSRLPIATIFLGLQKVYIVNSPELVSQVNRAPKAMSTALPFLVVVCRKLCGMGRGDLETLMKNPTIRGSLWRDLQECVHSHLDAGSSSGKEITTRVANELWKGIDECSQRKGTVNLSNRLQGIFTHSTGHAVFSPTHCLAQDPAIIDSLWTMANGLKRLTMWPFPSFSARTATQAREKVACSLEAYFRDNDLLLTGHSEPVKSLTQCIHKHGMDNQFAARFFLGLFSGFVINTVPAAFWLTGHISDDEQLKTIIREELNQVVTSDTCGSLTVSPEAVRSRYPCLMSTCHEVLRFISSSTSTFFIHQDTYLNDRYLLKKGAILQVTSTAIHSNTDFWGPAAQAFTPDRFVKPEKVHPSANRTFGGVAMVFHTFDVEFSPETPRLPAPMVTDMLSVKNPMTDLKIKRMKPIARCTMNRMVLEDMNLSDGTLLKKGTLLGVSVDRMWDGSVYENPQKWDGWRFYRKYQQSPEARDVPIVNTGPKYLTWGHGRLACAGRFFVTQAAQVALAHLLKYDWEIVSSPSDKNISEFGLVLASNPKARIRIRRRVE